MSMKPALIAVLTVSTFLTTGAAFAQSPASSQPPQQSAQQKTAMKDYANLSKDGSKGFQDIALARLAIFDGRTGDAKKYTDEADSSFDKAQHDETVFMKAEADLKPPQAADQNAGGTDKTGSADKSAANTQPGASTAGSANDMKQPTAWLPVDGELSITDDFTANPTNAAAVADANKSLAKGDRKGAIDKLKLANVDLDIVLAVVPVKQAVSDVHQAAQLVDSGKFYEASQMLRKVQDSARFDVADIVGVPKTGASTSGSQMTPNDAHGSGAPATH